MSGDHIAEISMQLCRRLVDQALQIHHSGLKAYGLLTADPADPRFPFLATDVVFLDPRRNQRNEPRHRAAFRAQGDYFRKYEDAGFVADPLEVLAAYRHIDKTGKEPVAMFHSHRRQPANFSFIDFRLHNPMYPWHLIISLRDPARPDLQPFRVRKDLADYGISEHDCHQNSEQDYIGPEVTPMTLRIGDLTPMAATSRKKGLPA